MISSYIFALLLLDLKKIPSKKDLLFFSFILFIYVVFHYLEMNLLIPIFKVLRFP